MPTFISTVALLNSDNNIPSSVGMFEVTTVYSYSDTIKMTENLNVII